MSGNSRGPVPVAADSQIIDIAQDILDALAEQSPVESTEAFPTASQKTVKANLDRLKSRRMIDYAQKERQVVSLTGEGQTICDEGSHEYKVWSLVKKQGKLEMKDLPAGEVGAVGQKNAMKNKWIKKDGPHLVAVADSVQDTTRSQLQEVRDTQALADAKALAELKKRKLVTLGKDISYSISKGEQYAQTMPKEVMELTAEMLRDGSWKTATFKPYNLEVDSIWRSAEAGALHPITKVRQEICDIFFHSGFTEMPTSRYVETGFWNFDTLFVPQQHPARDLQDTFYISDPPKADKPRADPALEKIVDLMESDNDEILGTSGPREPRDYESYWNAIKQVHQDGKFGSIGYRYPWSEDECLRLVLRTHTTAVTSWVLHRLAQNPRPARYFSIDRVFRNESVDATHLAEFHQIEGVIAQWDLTLGDGMGFLASFFRKLGISDVRFKPAYNPYTEPSMEVFGFHLQLNKWIEIGNSGVFRPEMLESMGLPKNLRVFGFGLSVERPTMIRYNIANIRELVGHGVDLNFVEKRGATRFDKVRSAQ